MLEQDVFLVAHVRAQRLAQPPGVTVRAQPRGPPPQVVVLRDEAGPELERQVRQQRLLFFMEVVHEDGVVVAQEPVDGLRRVDARVFSAQPARMQQHVVVVA